MEVPADVERLTGPEEEEEDEEGGEEGGRHGGRERGREERASRRGRAGERERQGGGERVRVTPPATLQRRVEGSTFQRRERRAGTPNERTEESDKPPAVVE